MTSTFKREFRVNAQNFTVDTEPGAPKIRGYAARFDEQSHILRDDRGRVFNEIISPGAFTNSLNAGEDIRALVDHDPAKIIGRTSAGTLTLRQDDKGLAFECELPDTSYGRDLAISMQRGDIKGCSFGMFVKDNVWSAPDSKGVQLRTLKEISLFEVTVTSMPAYPTSSAQLRSMFPDGVPTPEDVDGEQETECTCSCGECEADNCDDCSCEGCACEGCDCDNDPEFLSTADVMKMQLDLASL